MPHIEVVQIAAAAQTVVVVQIAVFVERIVEVAEVVQTAAETAVLGFAPAD